MRTRVHVLSLLALCVFLPAVAYAQWETPSRAFHKATAFALDGKHLGVACEACHLQGQYKGTPTKCADCHWLRRQDDIYRTRLGTSCEQCHRTTSWTAVMWDHRVQTGVALNAAHRTIGCVSCHKDARFVGLATTCDACHAADYAAAKTPDHKTAGFSMNCELCHRASDNSFQQGRFDHNATFQLVGVHATATCANCHVNSIYKGTPRDCVGCHRADYQRTTTPNHAAAGYSTQCDSCHKATDASWTAAIFNHASIFQLVGVHATIQCSACHVNNVFKGTPRDCVGCHQADYQKTTNPNHLAAQFPTTCDVCHKATDLSWNQGKFTHTWFPITSGRHANIACNICHTNPTVFTTFSCITSCHGRTETDGHHKGINGYSYDSNRCYACHPTGRAD